ncbi:hypothetical protein LCGC14_2469990 [marine sediment metagenome]|uniref:Uncharacterized protein n=1 Tax=marine sediment metagenome TaxID=412755 RepID=A0A0F9BYF1_9ZZZZ
MAKTTKEKFTTLKPKSTIKNGKKNIEQESQL